VFKRNVLAAALMSAALVTTGVLAQEVSVDGKEFLSGAADARLADLAKQAAAEGKHLVVTAPNYWQSKVAAKLHAGAANVNVQMKEGFFENVLVRIDDGKAKAAEQAAEAKAAAAKVDAQKAEAAKAEAARLEAARAQAERDEATRQETAKAEAAKAEAARQETARQEAARAEAAKAEAAKQQAAKAAADAKAKAEKEAADKLAAQKKTMLQNLNGGREADGTISAGQLQKDDQLGNNKLIFSNKTHRDIILKDEFAAMLGANFINTLTQENFPGYDHHVIDEGYLREKITNVNQQFYICGPDPMIGSIQTILQKLGASTITVEI